MEGTRTRRAGASWRSRSRCSWLRAARTRTRSRGRRRQRRRGRQADCGKVVLNEQAWAGSTANTYIAKAVLEDDLGCEVEITKIAEIPVFQAMADGKVDAVLEDWQHVDEYKKYIDKAGTVVEGGPLGVEGHIGWFIPKYLMDENPEFKTWEGLKGRRTSSRPPSPATRACSSAATRPTSRRTRS